MNRKMSLIRTPNMFIPGEITDTRILDSRTNVQIPTGMDPLRSSLVIWTGSFNMSAPPQPFDIRDMVHKSRDQYNVCMYAIALHEVTDPDTTSMTTAFVAWEAALDAYLCDIMGFVKMAVQSIGGTMLAVYIDKTCARYISDISVSTVALGPYGLKNKGAVGIRFKLGTKTFCIVSAHFTAGETTHRTDRMIGIKTAYKQRIMDYLAVKDTMTFKTIEGCPNKSILWMKHDPPKMRMEDHSNIIFMGDMNFRITPNDSLYTFTTREQTDIAGHYTDPKILRKLRVYDELLYAMTYDNVFTDFQEGTLTFKPTYKYTADKDIYDAKTARMPAWKNRILWKGSSTELLQYDTRHTIGSDHKPLHAIIVFRGVLPTSDAMS